MQTISKSFEQISIFELLEKEEKITLIIKYFDDKGIFYQDKREIPDEGNKGITKAVIEWRKANKGKYYFLGIETERKG